ncbi:hypothetical protein K7X08_017668 [Anisodus acutangulus]|uniref:Protein kinase domain-containing protein n=1 Tax=Anisodus acutangulus TaxID=402998 RepID=A0A9Q1R8E9_9SOLA|nr:hypothetical protein K7X08_017668 [Anisodus acutangulus]
MTGLCHDQCDDGQVSDDYGLFATYPLRRGENLSTVAVASGVPAKLLEKFNPGLDFGSGSGILSWFRLNQGTNSASGTDAQGNFPPLKTRYCANSKHNILLISAHYLSNRHSRGAIAGVTVAAIFGATFFAVCLYFVFYRSKHIEEESFLQGSSDEHFNEYFRPPTLEKITESGPLFGVISPRPTGITVDKSVEFSYEELAKATNNFSMENKIGQGGFGAVFYRMLKGERAAIKKMDMQASKEFFAELKVLMHVHHLNLARIRCRGLPGFKLLLMQLKDSNTSMSILFLYISTNQDVFLFKWALRTGMLSMVMFPDVYAFGVVLYELISAKEAIVKTNEVITESKGLVALFEDVLHQSDSVCKVAQLAKACTHENPQLRPSMRSIVVALMTLSSSTEDWDIGSFYENQGLVHIMSGR